MHLQISRRMTVTLGGAAHSRGAAAGALQKLLAHMLVGQCTRTEGLILDAPRLQTVSEALAVDYRGRFVYDFTYSAITWLPKPGDVLECTVLGWAEMRGHCLVFAEPKALANVRRGRGVVHGRCGEDEGERAVTVTAVFPGAPKLMLDGDVLVRVSQVHTHETARMSIVGVALPEHLVPPPACCSAGADLDEDADADADMGCATTDMEHTTATALRSEDSGCGTPFWSHPRSDYECPYV